MALSDGYPVELVPPDISAYRTGNTGVPYATRIPSGKPGPEVVVVALTHGNEICGAITLDRLFRQDVRPQIGALTLAFANVEAYETFDPRYPGASRFIDEDFNRLWDAATLDGPRQSLELARARRLRAIVDQADLLLDLHSMQHATPPLMLAGMTEKSLDLARKVGVPGLIVRDEGHAAGRRMRDYGDFSDPFSPKTALLVECGQHWESRSAEVAYDTTIRFLVSVGMLATGNPPAAPQQVITITDAVTIRSEAFEFTEDFQGMEVIPSAGTIIAEDEGRTIRTPYDNCVLIMPSRRLSPGQTAVRLGHFTG